jgi:hypothetical protein
MDLEHERLALRHLEDALTWPPDEREQRLLEGRRFEWGRGSLAAANDLRAHYIAALKAADAGDCRPLLAFLAHSPA